MKPISTYLRYGALAAALAAAPAFAQNPGNTSGGAGTASESSTPGAHGNSGTGSGAGTAGSNASGMGASGGSGAGTTGSTNGMGSGAYGGNSSGSQRSGNPVGNATGTDANSQGLNQPGSGSSMPSDSYPYRNAGENRGTSDHNFGWIGLVGLAGLAGLFRNHSNNPNDPNNNRTNPRI